MAYKKLETGHTYEHRNGSTYICIEAPYDGIFNAKLRRITDGWTLIAKGTIIETDGKIHWDYSIGGHWEPREEHI